MVRVSRKSCVRSGWLLVAGVLALGGCRSQQGEPSAEAPLPETLVPLDEAASQIAIFRGDGTRASWGELVDACAGADAVLIGETHGHPVGLSAAAALWRDLVAQTPAPVLCMEFYERDQQVALDDYLLGVTDAAGFDKAAHRSPGNNPPGHRAMVEAAKEHHRPVIAANAPRRYVRLARLEGYERLAGLTAEQRRLFVVPDPQPGGGYRDRFFELMSGMAGHSEGDAEQARAMVEGFYRSQTMWDATMADSVQRALADGAQPAVLVVGRFHVERDGGTVQLLRRGVPGVRLVTLAVVDEAGDELMDEDHGRADFVIYAGALP